MDGKCSARAFILVGVSPDAGREEGHHGGENSFIHWNLSWGADLDTVNPLYSFPAKTQGSAEMLLEFWLPPELVDMAGP